MKRSGPGGFPPRALAAAVGVTLLAAGLPAQDPAGEIKAGFARRDITPADPIWLSGYAARNRPSERIDAPLLVQAAAFADAAGERFVLVALDNCEVNRAFTAPVLEALEKETGLAPGAVIIVSSHTHSAPCLAGVLPSMFRFQAAEREKVEAYSARVREALAAVVHDALAGLAPARLHHGRGAAGFAMNRRVYSPQGVVFGENPEGPVDREVPVLRVSGPGGEVRGILFGYACHGTSIAGDDFYGVSGDYMAFAREHLERHFPGATALYLTGVGADTNPSPRGSLLDARRHGLELAGAVTGVLDRPLRPVLGPFRRAFARLDLPLEPQPGREKLQKDAAAEDPYVQSRARAALAILDGGGALPTSVSCPLATVRLGDDLSFLFLGGEPVVDYALRLKREFQGKTPWTVGYAFEVPCYIPSMRILKEGGYEADSSLIYYGIYGPFQPQIEGMILEKFRELMKETAPRG
jgi:hypothetical protein